MMRFFEIRNGEAPVAVVFHDSKSGSVICRSKNSSFLRCFDICCVKAQAKLKREDGVVRAVKAGPEFFDWADDVLDQVCDDRSFWSIGKTGDIVNTENNIEETVSDLLS